MNDRHYRRMCHCVVCEKIPAVSEAGHKALIDSVVRAYWTGVRETIAKMPPPPPKRESEIERLARRMKEWCR